MVIRHNLEEIKKMREVCRLTASIFEYIDSHVQVGVSTSEINEICHKFIVDNLKARPAPLNYKGYPKSICTSLNHVVCHGIPDDRPLKSGDILNIDIAIEKDGFYGDSSKMYTLGKCSPFAQRLVTLTQQALYEAIAQVRPGQYVNVIGKTIQKFADKNNLSIVREYCGHGIGKNFHQEPEVVHFDPGYDGVLLEPGMIFTIEPMLNLGKMFTKKLGDGWTVVTKDRSLSAQWEHTILVTETGHEILTKRLEEA